MNCLKIGGELSEDRGRIVRGELSRGRIVRIPMEQLLAGVPSSQPDTMISKTTLENAASFVNHLETQKEILCQLINRKHENFHFSFITFIAHTFLLLLVETRPCSIRYLRISWVLSLYCSRRYKRMRPRSLLNGGLLK